MELNHNKKMLDEKQGKKRSSDASYLRDKQQQENLEQRLAQATVGLRNPLEFQYMNKINLDRFC